MLIPQESLPRRRPNDATYLYVVNYDNFFRYLVYVEYECTNRCCVGIVGESDYFACTLDRAKVNKSRYFRHRVNAKAISINGDERAGFVGQQQKSPYKHVCANSGCQLRPGPIVQDCRMEFDP